MRTYSQSRAGCGHESTLGRSEAPPQHWAIATKVDGLIHSQLSRAGQTNTCRKLKTPVDVLADPTFLPCRTEMNTLHRQRRAMLLPRISPGPLLLGRVLIFLINADLLLLMDRDYERSPRRASFRGPRSREPSECRHCDRMMRRRPLCRCDGCRFAFDRRKPGFLQVDNAESRIDQAPTRDREGEQRDPVQGGQWQP